MRMLVIRLGAVLGLCLAAPNVPATAVLDLGSTSRVSIATNGTAGNNRSHEPSLSASGQFVSFESDASNLVPGDTNVVSDIFLRDRFNSSTARVSVGPGGVQSNGGSYDARISTDRRFVVFSSFGSNLVPGDANGRSDIFVRDQTAATTQRISVTSGGTEANSDSYDPWISGNGRYVAFTSYADNLVPGDTNGIPDVFLYDLVAARTTRVSVASDGAQANSFCCYSLAPVTNTTGRYVAFASTASNLVAGDTNGAADVFVHDTRTGRTSRISLAAGGGQANGNSFEPSVDATGRLFSFTSSASNLVPNDANGHLDAFVHDRLTGSNLRASVGTGMEEANGDSNYWPRLSGNGHYLAFTSYATNLVANDTNGTSDIFVRDLVLGTTSRVSVATGDLQAHGNSLLPSLSVDGHIVVFASDAADLVPGDGNGTSDVFARV